MSAVSVESSTRYLVKAGSMRVALTDKGEAVTLSRIGRMGGASMETVQEIADAISALTEALNTIQNRSKT